MGTSYTIHSPLSFELKAVNRKELVQRDTLFPAQPATLASLHSDHRSRAPAIVTAMMCNTRVVGTAATQDDNPYQGASRKQYYPEIVL